MVNNIQLTSQQKLQQEKINAYIKSLENSLEVKNDNIQLDDNLHDTLAGVFKAFDANSNSKFNKKETKVLVTHLKKLNSDNNIVSMFDKNGNLKLDSGGLDIDNDGNAGVQNDFVALSNMLSSKASVDYAESVMTGKGSKITLENGKQVSHGLGEHAVTFTTKGGYHIVTDTNNGGHQTKIFGADGKMLTHVSGDPHVNEGDSTKNTGWDWHFGDDSTFILDDGTEILFNTTGNAKNNVYVTRGLYIISDDDVYQTGLDLSDTGKRNKNISKLDISAVEFDALNADAKSEDNGADTFVYSKEANNGNGGWAVLTDDGTFEDVAYESWKTYLKGTQDGVSQTFDNQTVDTGNAVNASITLEQKEAALDGEAVRIYDRLEKAGATDNQKEAFFEYYFKEGANEVMLNAFTTLVDKNGTDLQFDKFDAYIKNPADIGVDLSSEQEANYLMLLISDGEVAETYLEFLSMKNKPDFIINGVTDLIEAKDVQATANLMESYMNLVAAEVDQDIMDTFESVIENNNIFSEALTADDFAFVEVIQRGDFTGNIGQNIMKNIAVHMNDPSKIDFINTISNDILNQATEFDSDESEQEYFKNAEFILNFTTEMFNDSAAKIMGIDSINDTSAINTLLDSTIGLEDVFIDVLEKQNEILDGKEPSIANINNFLIEGIKDANRLKESMAHISGNEDNINFVISYLSETENNTLKELTRNISIQFNQYVQGRTGMITAKSVYEFLSDIALVGEALANGEFTNEDNQVDLASVNSGIFTAYRDQHQRFAENEEFTNRDREYNQKVANKYQRYIDEPDQFINGPDSGENKLPELDLIQNRFDTLIININNPAVKFELNHTAKTVNQVKNGNNTSDSAFKLSITLYNLIKDDSLSEDQLVNAILQAKVDYYDSLIASLGDSTRDMKDKQYIQNIRDQIQQLIN